jgi:hypothetical protein
MERWRHWSGGVGVEGVSVEEILLLSILIVILRNFVQESEIPARLELSMLSKIVPPEMLTCHHQTAFQVIIRAPEFGWTLT